MRAVPVVWVRLRPVCVAVLFAPLLALAHDPYEITSTAYLRSNRLEVYVELEFRPGLTLAGEPAPTSDLEAGQVFERALPRLLEAAGGFFEIRHAGQPLAATRTNASLEVENHIRFVLTYPPVTPVDLTFHAAGLEHLGRFGPYGTSLTVLDMVNMKVVGQEVLFADTPTAEFWAPPEVAPKEIASATVPAVAEKPAPPNLIPNTTQPVAQTRFPRWRIGVIVIAFGIAVMSFFFFEIPKKRRPVNPP